MAEVNTCGRCGIADASVLNLDTGGTYHREPRQCINLLRVAADALNAQRDRERLDWLDARMCSKGQNAHGGYGYFVDWPNADSTHSYDLRASVDAAIRAEAIAHLIRPTR